MQRRKYEEVRVSAAPVGEVGSLNVQRGVDEVVGRDQLLFVRRWISRIEQLAQLFIVERQEVVTLIEARLVPGRSAIGVKLRIEQERLAEPVAIKPMQGVGIRPENP